MLWTLPPIADFTRLAQPSCRWDTNVLAGRLNENYFLSGDLEAATLSLKQDLSQLLGSPSLRPETQTGPISLFNRKNL